MRTLFLTIAIMLAAATAHAQDQGHIVAFHFKGGVAGESLTAVDLTAPRTLTLNLTTNRGDPTLGRALYSEVRLQVDYTFSAASEIQIEWKCSLDGTTYGTTVSRDVGGTPTLTVFSDTLTTNSVSDTFDISFGFKGCRSAQIVFTSTGGAAGDLVTVVATAIAGS